MKIRNNAGYTLVEMIIVLSITSTILLFFSQSFMNNFRFIRKYERNSPYFQALQALTVLEKDAGQCLGVQINGKIFEFEIPVFKDETRFEIRRVGYYTVSNSLVRKEQGEKEKIKIINLGAIGIQIDMRIDGTNSNLIVLFTETNGQTASNRLALFHP